MSLSSNKLFLVSGEGGHLAQMNRLTSGLKMVCPNESYQIFFVTDNLSKQNVQFKFDEFIALGCIREKSGFSIKSIFKYLYRLIPLVKVIIFTKKVVIISTGPGICIPLAFLAKIFKKKVIHVETWSRFYTKSLTGRIMYLLSDVFLVQNEELLSMYPKAIYSGRL